MIDAVLTYPTPEGTQEIEIEGDSFSLGRGSEVDYRIADDGLSRVNSTVYREGERVWIVDENSTNGTFVNGESVSGGGTPLRDGDEIKIGNDTYLRIRIGTTKTVSNTPREKNKTKSVSASSSSVAESGSYFLPVAIMTVAIVVIGFSALIIGINVVGNSGSRDVSGLDDFDPPITKNDDAEEDNKNSDSSNEKLTENANSELIKSGADSNGDSIDFIDEETELPASDLTNFPTGKKYQQMSDSEKLQYVEVKTLKVARMIGNNTSKSIPPAAVASIKKFLDAYVSRVNAKELQGCRFGDNLEKTYRRASVNAHFIIKNFYSEGLDPQIGLYLAMIESEHCLCLQSPTGPLGMFQFAYAAAQENGLEVKKGASPSNPDQRCEPEPSSKAAAKYMKKLSGRFGTGPLSIPLAVASYNSGQGALSKNLAEALNQSGSQQRSFWTLVANAERLSGQFKMENIKYVPKFFAAAIIGENPRDFGMNLNALSTYNQASQ